MKNTNNPQGDALQTDINRRELVRRAARLAAAALAGAPVLQASAAVSDNDPMQSLPPAIKSMPKHDMSGYGIPTGPPQHFAFLMYEGMTLLDLVGPLQLLTALSNTQIHLVGKTGKPVVSDAGGAALTPTASFDNCPKDLTVLFVPGGSKGTCAAMQDAALLRFLASRAKTARYVTSVCTGSLVLGAAGLLNGYKATTHWGFIDVLADLGATPVRERVVEDRNRITGAGVTSGIDFGLRLVQKLRNDKMAQAVQLGMEYNPQPPFHAGTVQGADPSVVQMMEAMQAPRLAEMRDIAQKAAKSFPRSTAPRS